MYLKYVEPPDSTEETLKAEIAWAAVDLIETYPAFFHCDIASIPKPEIETSAFIAQILDSHSIFQKARENSAFWDQMRTLRVIYRVLTCGRWAGEIETRLIALISHIFSNQLLAFRYLVATDIIENDLQENLKYNPDIVSKYLFNPGEESDHTHAAACVGAAEDEIARVRSDPEIEEKFRNEVHEFEDKAEAHIKKALPNVLYEIMTRLMMESIMASVDVLEPRMGTTDGEELIIAREVMDGISRSARRFTNERLGIKRGGKRSTTKFVWNDSRKREFYETTNNLVTKDGKPLWNFAFDELIGKDFSYHIITWLRGETLLSGVPKELWNDAIKAWKGNASDSWRLTGDKTPEAFAMYHAIFLLGFPKTAFSTMKKYFGQGKKLSIANKDG